MGSLTRQLAPTECWVCEGTMPDGSRCQCSKCRRWFHDGSCGSVPVETLFEPPDPDDLLRGQFTGGKKEKRRLDQAKCGVCSGRLPADRPQRIASFSRLLEKKKQEEEARKKELIIQSMRVKAHDIKRELDAEKARILRNEKRLFTLAEQIATLNVELHQARRDWKRAKIKVDSLDGHSAAMRSNLLDEMDRLQEYGQTIHYEIHDRERRARNLARKTKKRQVRVDELESDLSTLLENLSAHSLTKA